MTAAQPALVVVMGVSGTGKTTVARDLAARLRLPFAEADSFHSPANIAKMSAGHPLDDADRWPWLHTVADWLAAHRATGGVVACSALKRAYRDLFRAAAPEVWFLHLAGAPELITARVAARPGHFMPATLVHSQFADLEPLRPDEPGVTVDVTETPADIVDRALEALRQATR